RRHLRRAARPAQRFGGAGDAQAARGQGLCAPHRFGARLSVQPGPVGHRCQEVGAQRDRPGVLQRLSGERGLGPARHVRQARQRATRRNRTDDRPRTPGQRGQVMYVLIGIALKSLLIAGVTLGVLQLMKRRSAAERSAIAHLGLLALIIMALAPLVLPSYDIAAPALFGSPPAVETTAIAPPPATDVAVALPTAQAPVVKAAPASTISSAAAAAALYAVPAAILLFVTFLALARLIALRAR